MRVSTDAATNRDDGTQAAAVSDEELIAAVGGGDADAFTQLLARHLEPLHAYLFRMTGCRADAEDLAQETFLKVWRRAGSYRPGRVKPSTWLHTIAHNVCVDTFRRAGRRPELPLEEALAGPEGPADELADPARDHTLEHDRKRLELALGMLPVNQRSAVVLCLVQGYSNAQAAMILGVGTRALESLLARARRALRSALGTQEQQDD